MEIKIVEVTCAPGGEYMVEEKIIEWEDVEPVEPEPAPEYVTYDDLAKAYHEGVQEA